MFAIIGIVVVFGAVAAGYLMEHGNIRVLLQPAELLIIGGASIGTVLVANPLHILTQIAGGVVGVFTGSKYSKQAYIDSLKMMYELLNKARKDGLMALENDVEEPEKSPLFSTGPAVLKNPHVRDFVCDSLRMAITGVDAFDLDQMLDLDLEVHQHDAIQPTVALTSMADSLPGLGIVAAVLGVVITMGSLGGPPRRNRQEGSGRAGWHFPWHPFVLRPGRPHRRQHDESGRRGACLPLRAARPDCFFSKRHSSHNGCRSRAPRRSRSRAPIL
jgi:chemotaxis protein MotA